MAVAANQKRRLDRSQDSPLGDDLGNGHLGGAARVMLDRSKDRSQGKADGLRFRPARERLGDRIHPCDPALGIGRDDRVADAPQGNTEPLVLPSRDLVAAQALVERTLETLLHSPGGINEANRQ